MNPFFHSKLLWKLIESRDDGDKVRWCEWKERKVCTRGKYHKLSTFIQLQSIKRFYFKLDDNEKQQKKCCIKIREWEKQWKVTNSIYNNKQATTTRRECEKKRIGIMYHVSLFNNENCAMRMGCGYLCSWSERKWKRTYRILQFIQCSPLFYYRQYFNARLSSADLLC